MGIAVDPSFFVISAFCIIPLGVGLLSRYNVKRAEKYWEEREEMKKKGNSSKKNDEENYFDFSKKSTVGGYAYVFGLFLVL
ncbi:MAG: hypothetical protein ABEI74_03240 [Candidatus Pacearchaeota archaeon]